MKKIHTIRIHEQATHYPRIEHFTSKLTFSKSTYLQFKEYTESMHFELPKLSLPDDPMLHKFKLYLKDAIENLIKVKVVEECVFDDSTELEPKVADIQFFMSNHSKIMS